jgi:hypothetical protein
MMIEAIKTHSLPYSNYVWATLFHWCRTYAICGIFCLVSWIDIAIFLVIWCVRPVGRSTRWLANTQQWAQCALASAISACAEAVSHCCH